MSKTVTADFIEEYFCDSCHGEFTIILDQASDLTPADVKKCVFCGADLDNELNIPEDSFDINEWDDNLMDD